MNASTVLTLALSALLLTGCNTWEGVKQDARVISDNTLEGSRRVGRALTEPLSPNDPTTLNAPVTATPSPSH